MTEGRTEGLTDVTNAGRHMVCYILGLKTEAGSLTFASTLFLIFLSKKEGQVLHEIFLRHV